MKHQTPSQPSPPSCTDAAELMPWLLNGSLDEAESRRLRQHLAACEACRLELAEAADAWQLMTRHVPSMSLAEYAQGLPPSELSREQIEAHLEVCASCREEAELAGTGEVVDFETARSRRTVSALEPAAASSQRGVRHRRWAIAATVAAAAAGAMLFDRAEQDTLSPPASVEARAEGAHENEQQSASTVFFDGFESGTTAAWSPSTAPESNPENDAG